MNCLESSTASDSYPDKKLAFPLGLTAIQSFYFGSLYPEHCFSRLWLVPGVGWNCVRSHSHNANTRKK